MKQRKPTTEMLAKTWKTNVIDGLLISADGEDDDKVGLLIYQLRNVVESVFNDGWIAAMKEARKDA